MHFVIGANIPDSYTTGMGRQMHGLGEALANRGHRVEYLFSEAVPRRFPSKLGRLEYPIRAASELARRAFVNGRQLFALLHEPTGWPTALLSRRTGVRLLTMVHSCEHMAWVQAQKDEAAAGRRISLRTRIAWPMTELSQCWLSLKLAECIFCLSSEDRDFLMTKLGIRPDRVARIDNGLGPSFLGLPPPAPDRAPGVLFFGSWRLRKGTTYLLDALKLLAAQGFTFSLTIAGTGVPADRVRRELPHPWRERAVIVPHVPADELVALYARHAILVLPSTQEGIPLVLLEAMACGLYSIATSVGGIPDVLRNGIDGVLVPPRDPIALARAVADAVVSPARRVEVAQRGQARMQAYGWQRSAFQVEQALEQLGLGEDLHVP